MRKKARFSSLPTASGTIARAAYARALEARLEVAPLLKSSSLTPQQIKNSQLRIPAQNQIKFLSAVADKLPDPFLGIHLAEGIELREMGSVYYVITSSETLGDALRRLAASEVAWLLGFGEVSAFNHACKRWTGKTPKQLQSAGLESLTEAA